MLFFKYSAVNVVGESETSNEIVHALAVYPAAPENLVKVNTLSSLTSIHLKWDIVADYEINVIGYNVLMETNRNGEFNLIYDGRNYPGINYFEASGLTTGSRYRFKVAALNHNGVGDYTEPLEFFSCLPPEEILPPTYVSSTKTSLSLDWTSPAVTNGCPVEKFELYINDGENGDVDTLVAEFEPQVSSYTIDSFTEADTSKQYRLQVKGINAGGSTISGNAMFTLAAPPS